MCTMSPRTAQPAVLVVQGCIAVGLPAVDRLVDVAEVLGRDPTEREALPRRLDDRGDDLAPCTRPYRSWTRPYAASAPGVATEP